MNFVQQQLDAYNALDIDALLATYAVDVEHYTLQGELLAWGRWRYCAFTSWRTA